MPSYLQLTGTPESTKVELPSDSKSYPSVPRPVLEVLQEYMRQSRYLTDKDRASLSLEQQLDKVLSKQDRGLESIADFVANLFPGPRGSEYAGKYQGTDVYVGKTNTGTSGGYIPSQNNIVLNPAIFGSKTYGNENPLDVLAHEGGHAATVNTFGRNGLPNKSAKSGLTYYQAQKNVRDAYTTAMKNPTDQNVQMFNLAQRQYQDHPVEQLATWLGGLYGSWSNEPAQNPPVINKLFDAIYGKTSETKDTAAIRGSGR